MTAQIAGRPIGVMMGIGTALNPFTVRPSYKELESLPIDEQRKRLRDPEMRRKILAEKPSEADVAKLAQFRQAVTRKWDRFYVMGNPPDYEPAPDKSVAAIAARTGRPPDEVAYDYITGGEGQYLYFPVVNYVAGDHAPIFEMLNDPACLLGLERRRRALHLDRRCRRADLHADALGPRPQPRAAAAARASGQAPDQRDRRFLRLHRPRPAGARACAPTSMSSTSNLTVRSPNSSTICRPAAGALCSASKAMRRRWSPASRSSSAANIPARCPAASFAPAV